MQLRLPASLCPDQIQNHRVVDLAAWRYPPRSLFCSVLFDFSLHICRPVQSPASELLLPHALQSRCPLAKGRLLSGDRLVGRSYRRDRLAAP